MNRLCFCRVDISLKWFLIETGHVLVFLNENNFVDNEKLLEQTKFIN